MCKLYLLRIAFYSLSVIKDCTILSSASARHRHSTLLERSTDWDTCSDGVYTMAKDPDSLERFASGSGDGFVKVW